MPSSSPTFTFRATREEKTEMKIIYFPGREDKVSWAVALMDVSLNCLFALDQIYRFLENT